MRPRSVNEFSFFSLNVLSPVSVGRVGEYGPQKVDEEDWFLALRCADIGIGEYFFLISPPGGHFP